MASLVQLCGAAAMKWVCGDFETVSALHLPTVGAWRYAEDPTTEVLCFSYSLMGAEPKTYRPDRRGSEVELMELAADPDVIFLSFGDFERAIWKCIMVPVLAFPPVRTARWHDIQAAACMKQMPKDVDKLSRALELQLAKDMASSKFTISLSKPLKDGSYNRSADALNRVQAYCEQDVRTEVACHERLGWLPPGERGAWLENQRINERGIGLDLEYIRCCKEVVRQSTVPLIAEFRKLTGINPTQTAALKQWVYSQGITSAQIPDLTKQTMAEIFGETIDEDGDEDDNEGIALEPLDMPPNVHRALSIKRLVGSTSIKKLDAMEQCVSLDGRARGLLQYHGTGPGRETGRLLQPHNFPKPTVKVNGELASPELVVEAIKTGSAEMVELLVGPAMAVVVGGLRHAMRASKGRVFVSGDYSGVQARLVLAISGQTDKVALMASGADVYCDMASRIYKRSIDKHKDPKERGIGKNAVLGLGFQMAAPKFQLKYARSHPLDFCQNVVTTYRKDWAPCVPKFWYALQDAATEAVWTGDPKEAYGVLYQIEGEWLTATAPSGGKIWYYRPERTKEAAPWDPDEMRPGFAFWALKKHVWNKQYAFGGQLAENVIMRMEADLMRVAMQKLEKNGFPIVLEVHDEIVAEPLMANADEKAFHQIMLDTEPWTKHIGVPINVEGWECGPSEVYRK